MLWFTSCLADFSSVCPLNTVATLEEMRSVVLKIPKL